MRAGPGRVSERGRIRKGKGRGQMTAILRNLPDVGVQMSPELFPWRADKDSRATKWDQPLISCSSAVYC